MRQRLLEDRLPKGVAEDAQAASGLDAGAHLQESHLVQTAGEQVHRLAVLATAVRHRLVELLRLLHVRRLLALNVHVGANGLAEIRVDDEAGARGARTADEQHDVRGRLREGDLQQRRRHRHGAAGGALGTVLRRDGPLRERGSEQLRDPSPARR